MSVDFRAGLAFGWLVSDQEHREMVETTWELEYDFICVDSWSDTSHYVFGIWIHHIDMGSVEEFNIHSLADEIPPDFMGEWGAKLRAMGKGEWFDEEQRLPGVFLVGQVA